MALGGGAGVRGTSRSPAGIFHFGSRMDINAIKSYEPRGLERNNDVPASD